MGWLDFLRRPVPARASVTFDDEAVTCRRPNGLVERVRWAELQVVLIETTDAGPWGDDVLWVLAGEGSGCVVPSEAEGMGELLERLQRLPGFRNSAVIDAMGCAENRIHIIWNRADSANKNH